VKADEIYGFLPLYKQRGSSSSQEIQYLKKRLGLYKAGHCGTLDPLAEGVLPVLVNRATRTMRFFLEYNKSYRFTVRFGISTDTQDITGNVMARSDRVVTEQELQSLLADFKGEIWQKTPDFSARKYKGERLYRYARKGIEVPKPERLIRISGISLVRFDFPFAEIDTECSGGTYIRQLVEDICKRLGVAGTMYSLVRTSYGIFSDKNTKKKEELSRTDILPVTDVFFDFGRFEINEALSGRVINGSSVSSEDIRNIERGDFRRYFGFLSGKVTGVYVRDGDTFYPEVILVG